VRWRDAREVRRRRRAAEAQQRRRRGATLRVTLASSRPLAGFALLRQRQYDAAARSWFAMLARRASAVQAALQAARTRRQALLEEGSGAPSFYMVSDMAANPRN